MKISIITINLNNSAGLQKTIGSVVNQSFDDLEFIVIDGGSSDGSLDIIKKNSGTFTYWTSEQDRGIYHAMNKGILKASGKYCLFLNSGDYLLYDNVLSDVFNEELEKDILYGSIMNDYGNCKKEVQYPREQYITFRHFLKSTLPHPSTFIKRSLFDKTGFYNENLRITADWEFFLKAIFKNNASIKRIDQTVTVFDTNGISTDVEYKEIMTAERKNVLETHFHRFLDDYKYIDSLEKSIPFSVYHRLRKIKNTLWKSRQ